MAAIMGEQDKINLVVIGDGRHQYLEQCMDSLHYLSGGSIANRFLFDDSGNDQYRDRLRRQYPEWLVIGNGPRQGFAKVMVAVWQLMAIQPQQWVFHVEEDFTFHQPIWLFNMQMIMIENPHLAQIALLRQPWNAEERAAGGYMQINPGWFTERSGRTKQLIDAQWVEHRAFFTTNPHLTRRSVCSTGWEDCEHSEGHTSLRLFSKGFPGVSGDRVRSAILGGKNDEPRCIHIGDQRIGCGY